MCMQHKAWSRMLARKSCIPLGDLQVDIQSYNCLRQLRIRLDIVSMLLWRDVFATTVLADVNLYLLVDGSPQWRGKEVYAVSFDFIQRSAGKRYYVRRLCPVAQHGKVITSVHDKRIALIWMLSLMVGPFTACFLEVLSRIRSITSDLGTERKLAHLAVLAPEFWRFLGSKAAPIRRGWLFPNMALQAPGWAHVLGWTHPSGAMQS